MGPTPAKVGRIKARDTQTTWPDPWSIDTRDYSVATLMDLKTDPWSDGSAKLELAIYYGEPNRISRLKISGGVTSDLGSVIVDCENKH